MKKCSRCQKEKELSEFFVSRKSRSKDGLHNVCKECSREYGRNWYLKNLGSKGITIKDKTFLSSEGFKILLEKQQGKCAICGNSPQGKRLAVDHDHKTGKVRGLLCHLCNVGLGAFKDNKDSLKSAILYLEE